jgi:hypothetical protein
LPRPWLAADGKPRLPTLRTEILRLGDDTIGVDFAYNAPVEPGSGSTAWLQSHLWLNRPCCSLHFDIYRVPASFLPVPRAAIPFSLGGRRGQLLDAVGYAFSGADAAGRGIFWPNHTWFFWRERGVLYAASLHYFGLGETRRLLGQIIARLDPATG